MTDARKEPGYEPALRYACEETFDTGVRFFPEEGAPWVQANDHDRIVSYLTARLARAEEEYNGLRSALMEVLEATRGLSAHDVGVGLRDALMMIAQQTATPTRARDE